MSDAAVHRPPPGPGPLRGVGVVLRRELGAFFDGAAAYVYLVGALLLSSSLFMNEFFLTARVDMTPFFEALFPIALFLLPGLSMRLWAEDRRTRTFELWMTLPLAPWQVVAGKYLAALGVWCVYLVGTTPIVVMLAALGAPDLGLVASGYLGALCLGALLLAVGSLASALTSDQIVAFVLAVAVGALLYASGHPRAVAVLDGQVPGLGRLFADHVSALPRYEELVRGLVSLSTLVWFGGTSLVLLGLETALVTRLRQ
ncbi:MAG: ABC transporter permease [Planctomycetes bacterium]|nr:ABC transporter permease [Planctomycetota bacterium]